MSLPRSRELVSIHTQARDIARKSARPLSTAHLLLALFTVPNRAAMFLKDRNITVDALLDALKHMGVEAEEVLERIEARSHRIARGSHAESVNTLHLLAALVRETSSHAYRLLDETGVNVSAIRTAVMSYATGSRTLPSRFRTPETVHVTAPAVARQVASREHAPSPIGFHPSLRIETTRRTEAPRHEVEPVRETPTRPEPPRTSSPVRRRPEMVQKDEPRASTDGPDETPQPRRRAEPKPTSAPVSEESARDEALDEARRTARKLAESLFRKRKEILERQPSLGDEPSDVATGPATPLVEEEPAPASLLSEEASQPQTAPATQEPLEALDDHTVDFARSTEPPPSARPDIALARAYALDPEEYPTLTKFGRNLTEDAALGKIDRVVGRDREILQLIDILGKRRSNNPILVGDAGVGKTAIVEGLAREFVDLARRDNRLGKRAIIELEVGRIIGGTHLRGSFSERLMAIKDEVRRAEGDVIVFLDEIHGWMNAGAGGDGTDAAGELKTALARGQFPCIGATTADEFRKFVEADPAFERRFEVVFVDEPDLDTTAHIVDGIRRHYEDHHRVRYADDALMAAVRLSHRFIHERRLPDKAVGVLDLAGSRAARTGKSEVTSHDVASIVAELASIPAERLVQSDRQRFVHMEEHLATGLVGHQHVVGAVSEVIRRNYAGFRSNRPIGSLLFLGPTGVGKTELVKVLADFLFYDRDAIVRFDMSEFMESHSVSRLIGSPPGYVGFEQGGQLTEAVRRRPYQIVLLDEIEKAHPDVLNVLLQLLDEGRLTDGRGRTVDFSNTVVVMTSNLGSSHFEEKAPARRSRIGFSEGAGLSASRQVEDAVLESARGHFPPELWNRIDERLVFHALTRSEVARIAAMQLSNTARRLQEESGIGLVFGEGVVQYLIEHGGYDPALGARPMRQTIERLIEGAVARLILCGEATRGDKIYVDVHAGELRVYPEP